MAVAGHTDECPDCPQQRCSFPELTVETSGGSLISRGESHFQGCESILKLKKLNEQDACPLAEWAEADYEEAEELTILNFPTDCLN